MAVVALGNQLFPSDLHTYQCVQRILGQTFFTHLDRLITNIGWWGFIRAHRISLRCHILRLVVWHCLWFCSCLLGKSSHKCYFFFFFWTLQNSQSWQPEDTYIYKASRVRFSHTSTQLERYDFPSSITHWQQASNLLAPRHFDFKWRPWMCPQSSYCWLSSYYVSLKRSSMNSNS